jgi:hypothetical protein
MRSGDDRARRRMRGGATTGVGGTPVPVDVRRDSGARANWVVVLAGPVIWITHFMVVYLAAEAGCTGGGDGLNLFDPPIPRVLTLIATAVAVIACVPFVLWGFRWWRSKDEDVDVADPDRAHEVERAADRASAGFAGMVLALISIFAILVVGLPAAVLSC